MRSLGLWSTFLIEIPGFRAHGTMLFHRKLTCLIKEASLIEVT